MRQGNPDFMNGVPELLILKLLAAREMYGYELVQSIREQTNEAISLSEGVVYPTLHALEIEGALKSRRNTVNGRSRVYYSITKLGSRKLARIADVWSGVTKAVQSVLQGARHASAF
jgi:PadR family transcriptional regulator, regulatory protein PadR